MKSELKKTYTEKLRKEIQNELNLPNINMVPKVEKITVNIGYGKGKDHPESFETMAEDMAMYTGQKPVITKAKKAISNFKIRQGQPVGIKVTLRGVKMWFFLEKMIHIVLPRVKDFRGLPRKGFDGNGNYTFGLKDQLVFPEIDSTKVTQPHGLQIIINTSANSNEHAELLLEKLGIPFIHNK